MFISWLSLSLFFSSVLADKDLLVLVHGHASDPGIWGTFEQYFTDNHADFEIYKYDYSSKTDQMLRDTRDDLLVDVSKRLKPGQIPHFVGHSMGGLVARSALYKANWEFPDSSPYNYGTLVTLGTPNHGALGSCMCCLATETFGVPCTDAVKNMCELDGTSFQWNCNWLGNLNSNTEGAKDYYNDDWVQAWTIDGDMLVEPKNAGIRGVDKKIANCNDEEYKQSNTGCKGGAWSTDVHNSIVRKTSVLRGVFNFLHDEGTSAELFHQGLGRVKSISHSHSRRAPAPSTSRPERTVQCIR